MKHRFHYRFFAVAMVLSLMMISLSTTGFAAEAQDTKREFKDLAIFEPYENLNSEITGDYDETYAVKCVNGTFVGTEENGVASWLGIPYAKPPVGERRFKAPEYVDPSDLSSTLVPDPNVPHRGCGRNDLPDRAAVRKKHSRPRSRKALLVVVNNFQNEKQKHPSTQTAECSRHGSQC